MTDHVPTIGETISKIQAALRDYIEATYHIGHPTVIAQRRALLKQEGVLHMDPYFESTPRYQTDRRFDELELDLAVHTLFGRLTRREGGLTQVLYDPPYTHHHWVTTSQGRLQHIGQQLTCSACRAGYKTSVNKH